MLSRGGPVLRIILIIELWPKNYLRFHFVLTALSVLNLINVLQLNNGAENISHVFLKR